MAADNAGIFFFGPPPSAEDIAAAAQGAAVSIAREQHLTRITAEWPDVTLVVTINPLWDREVQLSGLRIGSTYSPNRKEGLRRHSNCSPIWIARQPVTDRSSRRRSIGTARRRPHWCGC
jgi:hypothetical protein